ncbi:MAG: PD40 domain-containing protein [Armatimonadetes bacterium]|nr:PD40 domain-containing protein [Armatimonadota bacterium]
MRQLTRFVWLLLAVGALPGCGGTRGTAPRPTGSATLTIEWPQRSRLIPAASNSVAVQVLDLGVPIVHQIADRPASGGFSTITLANLPVGDLEVAADAFPLTGAQGTPQATGRAPIRIEAGKTTDFALTLASTIARVWVDPPGPTVVVGRTTLLNARATMAEGAGGALVLVAPEKWAWRSANPAVATVNATGSQADVIGVTEGAAKIIATDTESGVSGWVEVTVTATPTQTRIAFSRPNGAGGWSIFTRYPDGTGETQVTTGAFMDVQPAWSADATRIAFSSNRPGTGSDIHVMNADGTGLTRVTVPTDIDGDGAVATGEQNWQTGRPSWSPDGTQIAFEVACVAGASICTVNADGTGFQRLTDLGTTCTSPSWSPDGAAIAYDVGTTATSVWVKTLATATETQVALDGRHPMWSPDGRRLACTTGAELFLINADGTGRVGLGVDAGRPAWSPDGSRLAFRRFPPTGGSELWFINADGTGAVRFTDPAVEEDFPAWALR